MNGAEKRMKEKLKEYEKRGKRRSPFRYGRYREERTKIECGQILV
jgi:hypothetical protein